MSPGVETQVEQWGATVEASLSFDNLGARLALSSLLCAVTGTAAQLERAQRELAELRAARPQLVVLQGGKP